MRLCERCKKAQATFHVTNLDGEGNKLERHLCDRCAIEEGWTQPSKPPINVNQMIEQFITGQKSVSADLSELVCENCGMSFVEFRNQGQLGCPNDYDVFREPLAKLLEKAHNGATHHNGKVPRTRGSARVSQQDIHRLKRQLEDAVAAEDYERAASLRDRIRELEAT